MSPQYRNASKLRGKHSMCCWSGVSRFPFGTEGIQVYQEMHWTILMLALPTNLKNKAFWEQSISSIIISWIMQLSLSPSQDIPLKWGQDQEESLNAILETVPHAILCMYPNSNLPFVIYPNASQKYATGAMLDQVQEESNKSSVRFHGSSIRIYWNTQPESRNS